MDKHKAWGKLLTKKKTTTLLNSTNPKLLHKILKETEMLGLEDQIVLLQRLLRRDLKCIVCIDDTHFWIEAVIPIKWNASQDVVE